MVAVWWCLLDGSAVVAVGPAVFVGANVNVGAGEKAAIAFKS